MPERTAWPAEGIGLIHAAGIIDVAEAELLIDCGFRHLGVPLVLGYHQEDISVEDAAAIVERLGNRATFFLITYLRAAGEINSLCHRLGVKTVQLHGALEAAEIERLRAAAPGLRIIKSLIVRADNGDALAKEMVRFAPLVDAFITDTFDPETGASGATGRTHDWQISRRLVDLSPKPVILAGGLTPANVGAAVQAVRPAGVDVHTGIEGPDGRKRRDLALAFVTEARKAFAALQ